MDVRLAGPADTGDLASLVWLLAAPDEQARQAVESFAADLALWCAAHRDSHVALVARTSSLETVGMAWLALVPRVPRPGAAGRLSADIQSVFVVPERRTNGIGTALVSAAAEEAERRGASRVTVQTSPLAVPLYERIGFGPSPRLLQRPREQVRAPDA